jgi:hypothetical protein
MVATTYDFIKKLEDAGFTPLQVEVLSSTTMDVANKSEIVQLERDLTNKIEISESRLEKRMDKLEAKVDRLEDKMDRRFDSLHALIKWLIGVSVALIPLIPAMTTWLSHAH